MKKGKKTIELYLQGVQKMEIVNQSSYPGQLFKKQLISLKKEAMTT